MSVVRAPARLLRETGARAWRTGSDRRDRTLAGARPGTADADQRGVASLGDDLTTREAAATTVATWPPAEIVAACSSALRHLDARQLESLGVTSTLRGEGRSVVAAAMAAVLAREYGRRTLLVELDLESPALARRTELDTTPGVAEVVRGEQSLYGCIRWRDDGLGLLSAGDARGAAPDLLGRIPASGLLAQLVGSADVVVADLPPLVPAASGAPLANRCAEVLLVVRAGVTPLGDLRRALEALAQPPTVILNGLRPALPPLLRAVLGA